jgi:hypothetical protein
MRKVFMCISWMWQCGVDIAKPHLCFPKDGGPDLLLDVILDALLQADSYAISEAPGVLEADTASNHVESLAANK